MMLYINGQNQTDFGTSVAYLPPIRHKTYAKYNDN